jgi:hypothetical protein
METDMHWFKFITLLGGLPPDCALNRKISMRFMDEAELKNMKGREREQMQRAIERVQIPYRPTARDIAAEKEFEDMWSRAGV